MKKLVWMFSGQGSQYYRMGLDLYQEDSLFRQEIHRCDKYVKRLLGISLTEIIFPKNTTDRFADFSRTLYTHPALFCIQYSLSQALLRRNIRPDLLLGYSLGEIVAAAVADVLPFDTALELVVDQARLLEASVVPGAMIAILTSPSIINDKPGLFADTWLVAHNYETHFVQAGDVGAVERIKQELQRLNMICQVLPVRIAFHTPHMDSIEAAFHEKCRSLELRTPSLPIVSASQIAVLRTVSRDYFWQAVSRPIRFRETLEMLERTGEYHYVDLGPSGTMALFVKYGLSPDSRSGFQVIMTPFNQASKNIGKLFDALDLRPQATD
jgi:bacillaene synthase trans-acting acyltransferase